MCWSGEASAVLATVGFTSTLYFYRQGESPALCAALAYFSLMELLQAYTYSVIDQCLNPNNQIATLLGYIHIAFQPFFINAVCLRFIPDALRLRIQSGVYGLCFIAAVVFLLRIYPIQGISYCFEQSYRFFLSPNLQFAMPFCGRELCSSSGQWHIAWSIPANGNIELANAYTYSAFGLPLLYGCWRLVAYHFLSGPFLAYLTTNNMNEWAAVWCLYSIGLLLIVIKSPLRRYMYVNSWYGIK